MRLGFALLLSEAKGELRFYKNEVIKDVPVGADPPVTPDFRKYPDERIRPVGAANSRP